MDSGREIRRMVTRKCVYRSRLLRGREGSRVDAADKPNDAWHTERRAKDSEILTCGGRVGFLHAIDAELLLESAQDVTGSCLIVVGHRVLAQHREFRRLRGTRRGRLRLENA